MPARSTKREEQAYLRAYHAAQAADARFTAALEREHKGRAGDVRYQPAKQSPAVRALGALYQRAAAAMGKALEEMRKVGGSVSNPPARRNFSAAARKEYTTAAQRARAADERFTKAAIHGGGDLQALERARDKAQADLRKAIVKLGVGRNPAKLERCVRAVAKKGAVSPYAVCKAQLEKNPHLSQLVYLDEKGQYQREGPVFEKKGLAIAEAKSLAAAGQSVEVVWKDSRTGKYHDRKFLGKGNPGRLPIYSVSITQAKRIPTVTPGWVELTKARAAAAKEGSAFIGQVKDSNLKHVMYAVPAASFSVKDLVALMREPGGGFRAHEGNPAIDATHQLRILVTKGKPGKGLVYAKKIGGKWHYESYGKWHLVEPWRKPEIVHGPYDTGRKNARGGFSVVQGKASADVTPAGSGWVVHIKGDKPKEFKSVEAAAKYARLRVHEVAPATRNGVGPFAVEQIIAGKKSLTNKLLSKLKLSNPRGNPQDSAERMYHIFHGKPATQVIEFVQREHVHEWLWAAGTLVSIVVANGQKQMTLRAADPDEAPIEDVVMVGFSEDGKQAYFVGGDQDIDLEGLMAEFGMTEDDVRDHMKLGQVRKLTYRTSKNFEEGGKVDIDFYHKLGGEHSKGVMPDLVFKPLNPSMELVGGRYFVAPKDAQLGASPGVVG